MKKTLVALAVAAVAATSANAAVVYDNDGTKFEVKGSLRLLLAREGDQRGDLKNDGSRLIFNAEQQLANGLSAFGQAQIRFDKDKTSDNSFADPRTKRLFGGLAQEGVGALSFGKQATNGDDVQLGDYAYTWGGNNNLTDEAKKSVKFRSADFNGFSFGLDYIFGDAQKRPADNASAKEVAEWNEKAKNGYGAAIFYSTPFYNDMQLNLTAGYGQDKNNAGDTNINWRTAAEVVAGPFAVAGNYGQSKQKGSDTKLTSILVGAKYTIADTSTVYGEWMREKISNGGPRLNSWVAGVDYKLHKNVVTFVEFARAETPKDFDKVNNKWNKSHENKYGAGLRVFF